MRSGGRVLLTQTKVTEPGSRPAVSAAATIAAFTARRLRDTSDRSDVWFTICFLKPVAHIVGPMTTLAELSRRLKPRVPNPLLPPLILMTDRQRLANPIPILDTLPHGSAVILRHYGDPDREYLAFRLAARCRALGLRLLISEDISLASRVRAHGLHLPEKRIGMPPRTWRTCARKEWLVTAAAHSPRAVMLAGQAGADAVLLSPVFPTKSHPGAAAIGSLRFAAWVRQSPVPVYALGGIGADTARRLFSSSAAGFAGIGGFTGPARTV